MDTSSIDHLPDEIIEFILSRCPAKSVGRFKSVSKSWQSIISDPRFSRIHHIQRSKLPENQNKFLICFEEACESGYVDPYYMTLDDGKLQIELIMDHPFRDFNPLSSCDGLILLWNGDDDEYMLMLWNPLIGKHITIPAFNPKTHPVACRHRPHYNNPALCLWLHHLYFDSITNDYKILLSYENWYTVYSCKNGIWGERKDIPGDLHVTSANACVDGCIYGKRNGEIVCFDARDGKLHTFPQPNDVEGLVLTEISGRLCLKKWSRRRLQLWVMEENGSFEKSWRKIISMEKEDPDLWDLALLCLTNDDVILSARVAKDAYVDFIFIYKYNSCENGFQHIECPWEEVIYGYVYFPYSENLYMPSSNICVLIICFYVKFGISSDLWC